MENQVMLLQPPLFIDVLDRHNGFTAETTPNNTLWRPVAILRGKSTNGQLMKYKTNDQYQNTPATKAWYKVKGYPHLVVTWFDNQSGKRIA